METRKNTRFIPDMVGDLRQPVEAIADNLLAQGEDLAHSTTSEDMARWQVLTPTMLGEYFRTHEQHRPLDRIIKSYQKTIRTAMGDVVYYERDGWEVVLGEQPRQMLDRDRLIREFREVYDRCQHMIVARILNVIPPKGFQ